MYQHCQQVWLRSGCWGHSSTPRPGTLSKDYSEKASKSACLEISRFSTKHCVPFLSNKVTFFIILALGSLSCPPAPTLLAPSLISKTCFCVFSKGSWTRHLMPSPLCSSSKCVRRCSHNKVIVSKESSNLQISWQIPIIENVNIYLWLSLSSWPLLHTESSIWSSFTINSIVCDGGRKQRASLDPDLESCPFCLCI